MIDSINAFKYSRRFNEQRNLFFNRFNLNLNYIDIQKLKFPLLLIGGFIVVAGLLAFGISKTNFLSAGNSFGEKTEIAPANATLGLNKELIYPLKDDKGTQVSQFKYTVEDAELRDEIIVKGQRATAIKGRTFLILNLKINNEYNQAIQVNTRDYIRLSVNNNEAELLAPDIHNDPVEIQAISTKFTRVGFPINESDTNIKLKLGEINGNKESVDINF